MQNRAGYREIERQAAAEDLQLSVVVPCLNEEDVIKQTCSILTGTLRDLGLDYEIVFVDDGSSDQTPVILRSLSESDPRVRVVRLSRCFGHQLALSAGLEHAGGAAVVMIDADLQDPPELIVDMVGCWREGADVVYGVRQRRAGESWLRRFVTDIFYRVMGRCSPISPPVRAADFRLLDRRVVELLRGMPEPDRYLRGMVAWLGLEQKALLYDRRPRMGGRAKYNLRKLSRLAMDGLVSTGPNLLRAGALAGLLASAAMTIACGAGALWTDSGTLLLGAGLGVLGGLHFGLMILLGEYIARILTATLQRPMYVVAEQIGFGCLPGDRSAAASGQDRRRAAFAQVSQ